MTSALKPLAKSPLPAVLVAVLSVACGEAQPADGSSGGASAGGMGQGGASGGSVSKGGSTSGGSANGGSGSGGTASGGTNSSSGGASGSTGSGGSGGGQPTSCTNGSLNANPFGCELAWGAEGNQGNRASYLDFITGWVGSEQQPQAQPNACYGCDLVESIQGTSAIAVFYGYIIGEMGHANGLPDCNQGGPPNLCTHGAQMIRDHRDEIIDYYGNYARRVYDTDSSKPVVWLLEGDFIQYNDGSSQGIDQMNPLSYQELGQLAEDITCAIKANQPNAVVAMNHTPWNGNEETTGFWDAMPLDVLDLVWTTGVGNNDGFLNEGADSGEYNAATATYAFISNHTQKNIFVDISYGASQMTDSWTGLPANTLNDRISQGVIAVNAGTRAPNDYQSRISNLAGQLSSTCQ